MQVATSALASPQLANPRTPLTQLTPTNIATPINHRHVPATTPTTPNQTNANSNHNLPNSATISPINFIYKLFSLASIVNSIEPLDNTPKINKRHSHATRLLIGSLNDSYNFRPQRCLNYYES